MKTGGEGSILLRRHRPLLRTASAVALAVVAAGCGPGSSKAYSLAATEHCLDAQPTIVSYAEDDADVIALGAPGGGVRASLAHNAVTLGFERTAGDASDELRAASALGASEGAKLHADANVYVSWDYTPTTGERAAVEGCLRSGAAKRLPNKYTREFATHVRMACITSARSAGATAAAAATGCGCVLRAVEDRYSQDEMLSLSTTAFAEVARRCALTTTRTSTSATPTKSPDTLQVPVSEPAAQTVLQALRTAPDIGPNTRLIRLIASGTDPSWALAVIDSGPNTQPEGALVHQVGPHWKVIASGSEFSCSLMPPPQIKVDLHLTCIRG